MNPIAFDQVPVPMHTKRHRLQGVVVAGTFIALLGLAAFSTSDIHATEVVVRVTGIVAPIGQIGCSLFKGPEGFPMDNTTASNQWHPAQGEGVTCRFPDVAPGQYAVSIGHDTNGNRRVDTNFVGMPTEQWGVSGNARPTLRAPRFEEAMFTVAAENGEVVVYVKVAR